MSKLEITIKADELIVAITRLTAALTETQIKESAKTPAPIKEEKPVTIEQVRALLAEKSQSGKQAAVKDLITRYGAVKLTEVDPAKYPELLAEAEAL